MNFIILGKVFIPAFTKLKEDQMIETYVHLAQAEVIYIYTAMVEKAHYYINYNRQNNTPLEDSPTLRWLLFI